jgi:enamine deaminase RidA (YjgF/YER057c/UK114 family)
MSIERFRPDSLTEARGFAHVVAATGRRTIITSGQLGVDKNGNLVGDGTDYRAQARQAHLNLYAALDAAGATPADIAKLTIYVVDPSEENMNEAYAGIAEAANGAGARSTATMLMGVTRLGLLGAVYEVDAIAVVD